MPYGLRARGVLYASLALSLTSSSYAATKGTECRNIPSDSEWPTSDDWNTLNRTVEGRLIANVPIAAVCHGSRYDQEQCHWLRNNWHFPQTHLSSPSSPMAYFYTDGSCDPFAEPKQPCDLGPLAVYTVNATTSNHYKAAIDFVNKHNIRLVIRNSGHDYLGKSTGAHSLALWTHYLKSLDLIKQYKSKHYSGAAIKMGAGVEGGEAQAFADMHSLAVVVGNCPNVKLAGGYAQGGGHSTLSATYGLAADQVLEWEVMTADGKVLKATPEKHSDLFWALCGGGGGTWGAVLSMTVKAHPTKQTSAASLMLPITPDNVENVWTFVERFLGDLGRVVDTGVMVIWVAIPNLFMIAPAMAPGFTSTELDAVFQTTIDTLQSLDLQYQYTSQQYDTIHGALSAQPAMWNVSDFHVGGRLLPRSVADRRPAEVAKAVRHISENGLLSGVSYNLVKHAPPADQSSVNSHLREAIASIAFGLPINYTHFEQNRVNMDTITNNFVEKMKEVVPDGGAYLNEADINDPDWQQNFYGGLYDRLDEVKRKYDPNDIFHAKTGVGSHRWAEREDGRLCRVEKAEEQRHSEL
jgi:FAD/FMN-containing dehydrogenase